MPLIYSSSVFGQPPQALSTKDKNEAWKRANLDWAEQLLRAELPAKKKKLTKNYNVAQGVIDIEDYINVAENEYKSIYTEIENQVDQSIMAENEVIADDLHCYPVVPSIINVLVGELVKKFDHLKIKAVDDYSTNDYFEYKKQLVVEYIKQKAQAEILSKMGNQDIDPNSEQGQQVLQQEMQQVMSLPDIQKFMNRNYKSNYEEWANRIMEQSQHKYGIAEKEPELFKHQLITDEAYMHIRLDDDIDVEVWNPIDTYCLKNKNSKYVSDSDFIGRQYFTTIGDVVSKYRDKIDHALLEKFGAPLGVSPVLGDTWRPTPDDYQSNMNAERKLLYFKYLVGGEEYTNTSKVLLTECYWKSYRRFAKVTSMYIGMTEPLTKILDDTFEVTMKPEYDDDGNLIYGEEVEYFYAPQIWKGTKLNFSLGSNPSNIIDENDYLDKSFRTKNKDDKKFKSKDDVEKGVLYIDVQPVEYQFCDSINPFRPKIPVAGCDGFEPGMNVGKLSLVDKTKPYQVLLNACLNQIDNFMKTEIGLFYVLDQKLVPRSSIDGEWNQNNWLKFIMTAKETQMGVVDQNQVNMEGGQAFPQPTVVNLLKNPQFESRLNLAVTFKNMLFEVIGITPQRLGTIAAQETATGVNQAINNSYSQTEVYFFNHTNLMCEFKGLLLDAEKYMESKKNTSRIQYLNSNEENIIFEIDTDDLLLRRYNIYLTSNPDSQRVLEQLRQLAIQNNTAGANLLDLATIIESNNTREIKDVLKASIDNMQAQQQAQQEHEKQLQEQQLQVQQQMAQEKMAFEADQNERDRKARMYEAEVKAMGFAKNPDADSNGIADLLEIQRYNLEQHKTYSDILNQNTKLRNDKFEGQTKLEIEKAKIAQKEAETNSKERMKDLEIQRDYANMQNDIRVAKENAKGRNKSK